jgi:putative NADH-flavin reductase
VKVNFHTKRHWAIYFALLLEVDGGAGTVSVSNFGSLVTTPLTASDFEDVSTSDEVRFQLKVDHDYTFDIPAQGGVGTTQSIAFDAAEVKAASVPEPATLLLVGGVGMLAIARRRNLCSPES